MRKAILLYNPLSGRRRGRRLADVEAALAVLRNAGVEASAAPTRAASDATDQTRQAIAAGCDTVFACGGDGTIHDVLQGLVGTNVALAIIPLGTANSLAHDLRLPLSPADAALAALKAKPRRIAVGRIEYQDFAGNRASRYFTVTVGIGVDAHLFYKLDPLAKRRFGMAAYCAKATRLWLTHRMENFAVEITEEIAGKRQSRQARSFAATRSSHRQFWRSAARTRSRRVPRPRRPPSGALPHPQPRGVSALRPPRTLRHKLESPRNRIRSQHGRSLSRSRIIWFRERSHASSSKPTENSWERCPRRYQSCGMR